MWSYLCLCETQTNLAFWVGYHFDVQLNCIKIFLKPLIVVFLLLEKRKLFQDLLLYCDSHLVLSLHSYMYFEKCFGMILEFIHPSNAHEC